MINYYGYEKNKSTSNNSSPSDEKDDEKKDVREQLLLPEIIRLLLDNHNVYNIGLTSKMWYEEFKNLKRKRIQHIFFSFDIISYEQTETGEYEYMVEEMADDSYKINWAIETNTIEQYNKVKKVVNKFYKIYIEMYEDLFYGIKERNEEHIITIERNNNAVQDNSLIFTTIKNPNLKQLTENQIKDIINDVNYNWATPINNNDRSTDQQLQNLFFY